MKRLRDLDTLSTAIGLLCILYAQYTDIATQHDLYTICGTVWVCTGVVVSAVRRGMRRK